MSSSGLIKYAARQRDANGTALHWGRVAQDGFPFRGDAVPTLREAEYDERVVPVIDAKVDTFDMADPKQRKRYIDILDKAANGWFQILHIERFFKGTKHYVEWLEAYMEDGAGRVPLDAGAVTAMELAPGQPPLAQSLQDYARGVRSRPDAG